MDAPIEALTSPSLPPSLPPSRRYSAPPSRSYSPGVQSRGYVQPVPVLPYGGYGYGFSPFSPFSPFGFVSREGGREERGRERGVGEDLALGREDMAMAFLAFGLLSNE